MKTKYQYGKGITLHTILLTKDSRNAQSKPTLSSTDGDVKISKDDGAFVNITTLPTVSPANDVKVKIVLSDTECEAQSIMIRFKDVNGDEWEEQTIVLDAVDIREQMVEMKVPASFQERSSITSQNITRSGKPSFGAEFTTSTSPTKNDFDTRNILGAVVFGPEVFSQLVVLGGYFFDTSDNKTYNPFGVAKDPDLFGITDGGTTLIETNWTGPSGEAAANSGWTFITQPTDGNFANSTNELQIYLKPGFTLEAVMNDMLDLRRMWLENDDGSSLKIASDCSDDSVSITNSNGGNALHLKAYPGKSAIHVEGATAAPALKIDTNGTTSKAVEIKSQYAEAIAIEAGNGYGSDGMEAIKVTSADSDAVKINVTSKGSAFVLSGNGTGKKDIDAKEIGTPVDLGDGASLAANATSLAGKTSNAGSYDRATDSQEAIRDRGDAAAAATVAEVWSYVIHGTGANEVTAKDAVAESHSYSALAASRNVTTGAISYKDPDGTTVFTLTPSTTGRTRS